ncbi:hypothetical protein [Virgisporangium ochraceum]|uniref:hypothetical protein n=1 Tax=Virgisporangium ochraceum TaxID=65505 RepID=UPI001943922C|nr:hypothetical protein [Virgisporangium ochraceum]
MKKWVTAVAVVAAIAGVGLLVWWQWDPIWSFVFSPVGGFVAKLLFTGKVLKVVAVAAFAAGAGWVAVRRKLRRGTPEAERELAPPVFGPPEEEASAPPAPTPLPPVAPPAPAFTSAGTGTATTTEPPTAPPSRPI